MPPDLRLDLESTRRGDAASGSPTLTDDASPTPEPEFAPLRPLRPEMPVRPGLIIILGALNAVGALGIDTYLPAFNAIADSYRVSEGRVQLSLASYFVAAALGQTVYGPVSDRYGRRLPLLIGLALFVVASVGSALSPNVETLIAMRFFMGFGACSAWVVTRAVVRDLSHGESAARLFALMMLVLGVSPVLAPLLGSLIVAHAPWPLLFWSLALFAAVLFVAVARVLPETHAPAARSTGGIAPILSTYARLMRDRSFTIPTLVGALSQSVLFAYLAASPFVYMKRHGVSPEAYSGLFALNAVGLIGLAQVAAPLLKRFGANRIIRLATGAQALATLILLALVLTGKDALLPTVACLFVAVGMQGLVGPTSTMLALEPHPEAAGAASALSGTIGFAFGAILGGLIGALADGTTRPFGILLALCGVAALLTSFALPKSGSVAD